MGRHRGTCRPCRGTARIKRLGIAPKPVTKKVFEVAQETSPQDYLQVAKLKSQVQQLQANLRELETLAVTSESLRELIGSLGAPNVCQKPDWMKGAGRPRSNHGTAIALLSDVHFDEVVHSSQIGGCNAYNREIATNRLKNFFKSIVMLLKRHLANPKYDGIVLNLGGDLLSGNIHDELAETNAATINQSMLALEEILLEGITVLADEFGKVHVPCVTGNHGRMHKKPRAKNRAFENFEWAIYQRLVRYMRNDSRVTFDIPDGPDALYTVYGRRYCLTHGDQFSGGGGIGGIMIPINRGIAKKQMRQQAIGDPFDLVLMGHWHQYIHTASMVVNGSVKGYDEYAFSNNFSYEPPQQALFIEHPTYGVTIRLPVLLDKEV